MGSLLLLLNCRWRGRAFGFDGRAFHLGQQTPELLTLVRAEAPQPRCGDPPVAAEVIYRQRRF
jgi:hypothetical protein